MAYTEVALQVVNIRSTACLDNNRAGNLAPRFEQDMSGWLKELARPGVRELGFEPDDDEGAMLDILARLHTVPK